MKNLTRFALALPVLGALFSTTAQAADEPPCPFYENRSGLCGYYHSEISPAKAFVDTVAKRGSWSNPSERPLILDVRSTPEYKAGHPQHAVNVPWPFIYSECNDVGPDGKVTSADGLVENDRSPDGACISTKAGTSMPQNVADFVNYVNLVVPDKDTPIYTLCRTGVRSVGAANVLIDAGYTNVRNIWEGFWGIKLTAPKKQADTSVLVQPVDLNHDGVVNDLDNNGWRNHQDLPYETRLLPNLIYQPMAYLYDRDD